MILLILLLLLTIVLIINIRYEKFKNLIYNSTNLETRYHNIKISKRDSNRDFNEDYMIYYNYPYKCLEYQDIINNNYLND